MAKNKHLELAAFDASDYLDSEEVIAEYLVAAHAGLGRESLYKALRPGARPRFDTVRRLLTALGVRLDVVATAQRR